MRKAFLALLCVAGLGLPVLADETAPADPSPAAMTFAGQFSDDQLSGMLSRIGARQQPMMALSQLDGAVVAAVFDAEIDRAVAAYGPQWQRNMALAWTGLMTDDEFISLTVEGADSAAAEKYAGLRNEAGQGMQKLSSDLFQQILAEVIQNTIKELGVEGTTQ